MDVLSKWKQHHPLQGDVDLEMLGPDLLASRHPGLATEHQDSSRKNVKTLVRRLAAYMTSSDALELVDTDHTSNRFCTSTRKAACRSKRCGARTFSR